MVPGVLAAPSTHVCTPVAQDVTPDAQALRLPVQDWPSLQATHAPLPLHTIPAPHDVPGDRFPKSSQTRAPVEQPVMPVLHGFGLSVQLAFAVHATHVPVAPHTMLLPQVDPVGLMAPSAQVCAPVAQDVVPALHGFGLLLHAWPDAHATQVPPPSQTWPTPQTVPPARFAPSLQEVMLPVQLVVPSLHGVGLPVQVWLATQAPQKPLPSHIWPPLHGVLDDFGVPSTHSDLPVTHDVMPLRQMLGLVVQAIAAVHGTHVPLPLQTWLVPQVVPAAVVPASTQRSAPVVQSMTPVLHGAPGLSVQALPAWQVTHWPLPLQTWPMPHGVPASKLSPSTQPEADPQEVTPTLQRWPGLSVHTVPAAQVVQTPVLQTLSIPQNFPSASLVALSTHSGAPLLHAIAPFLHRLPALVGQGAPVEQGMQVPAGLQTWSAPQDEPAFFGASFMHPAGSQTTTPFRH